MLLWSLIFSLLLVGGSWAAPMEYEDTPEELDFAEDIGRISEETDNDNVEELSETPDEPAVTEDINMTSEVEEYDVYNPIISDAPKPISSSPTTLTPKTSFFTSTTHSTPTTFVAPTSTYITTSAQTTTLDPTSPSPVTLARPVDDPMALLRPIHFTTTVQVGQQITLGVQPLVIYEPINQIQQVIPLPYTQYVLRFPEQSPYMQYPIINHLSPQVPLRLPKFGPQYQLSSYPILNVDQPNKCDDSISRRLAETLMKNDEFLNIFVNALSKELPPEANVHNPDAITAELLQTFRKDEKFKQILLNAYTEARRVDDSSYEFILGFVESLINDKEFKTELVDNFEEATQAKWHARLEKSFNQLTEEQKDKFISSWT